MKKNILVLGGLGFIGSNIIEELLKHDDYKIFVFDYSGIENRFGNKITTFYGDFGNEEDIENIFKYNKIDIVIHLISTTIPATSNYNIRYDIDANLTPTIDLLNILIKYKVEKIVFFSSGGTVYGITTNDIVSEEHHTHPISSHGVIKLCIEKFLHLYYTQYGLNYLILRVGNPYGPYQKSNKQGIINVFLRKLLNNEKLVIRGDGTAVRDYIYVEDLAIIVKNLLLQDVNNEILNVGSGKGVSVNDIVKMLKNFKQDLEIEYIEANSSDVPSVILDVNKLKSYMEIELHNITVGIEKTYKYLKNEVYR